MNNSRGLLVLLGFISAAGATACGKDKPAQHPIGSFSHEASARIGLITLIVNDADRARRVTEINQEILALAPQFNRVRGKQLAQLAKVLDDDPAFLVHSVAEVRAAEIESFKRYRELMLELRGFVTAGEYARLMALR